MFDAETNRHTELDRLRAHSPVYLDPGSGSYVLSRMDDARAVLADATLWKDADRAEEGSLIRLFKPADMNRPGDRDSGIGWMDNPDHTRVRQPLQMALNRRVAKARDLIQAAAAERLAALAQHPTFDVVADYATPIPIAVIGHILGVDTGEADRFRAWSEAAIGSFNPDPTAEQRAATKGAANAIMDYLDEAMARRRAQPRDDLVSDLLALQAGGTPLSDSEIRVNCMNLLLGGNVTTADLISSAVWLLLSHPDQLARLRSEPGLINGAIEEVLRMEPPTEGAQRVASGPMQIRGCPIHEGKVVAALIHAANRDPAVFPDPHRFDIARRDGPHLAFGAGAHICIGQALARLEAQIAVGALVARFPGLRLADPQGQAAWRTMPYFRGLERLAVSA